MSLPLGFFDNAGSGKLRRTISESVSKTEEYLAHQLPDMVGAYLTPIVAIVMLFIFDWKLGLLSLIGIIICFLPYLLMMGIPKRDIDLYTESLNSMNNEAV